MALFKKKETDKKMVQIKEEYDEAKRKAFIEEFQKLYKEKAITEGKALARKKVNEPSTSEKLARIFIGNPEPIKTAGKKRIPMSSKKDSKELDKQLKAWAEIVQDD